MPGQRSLEKDPSIPDVDMTGDQLLKHAKVYTLAEKFGLPHLKNLASSKIHCVNSTAKGEIAYARYVYEFTSKDDTSIRAPVANFWAMRSHTLRAEAEDEFRSLCLEFPQFGYDVLSRPCPSPRFENVLANLLPLYSPRLGREAQARSQREDAPWTQQRAQATKTQQHRRRCLGYQWEGVILQQIFIVLGRFFGGRRSFGAGRTSQKTNTGNKKVPCFCFLLSLECERLSFASPVVWYLFQAETKWLAPVEAPGLWMGAGFILSGLREVSRTARTEIGTKGSNGVMFSVGLEWTRDGQGMGKEWAAAMAMAQWLRGTGVEEARANVLLYFCICNSISITEVGRTLPRSAVSESGHKDRVREKREKRELGAR